MRAKLREWSRRFWSTLSRRGGDVNEELRFHLEMAEEEALRRGESPRDARLKAGGAAQAAEAVHDQSVFRWLEDLLQDVRYGMRVLGNSPVFTLTAILSLALGIGANTAIFSLLDTLMFRNMPVQQPEQLVQLIKFREPHGRGWFSYPLYRTFQEQLTSLQGALARAKAGRREVSFGGEPEPVNVELVSGNYYQVLGVQAVVGRTFDASIETQPRAEAVISHAYWQRRFGMDPGVVGRTFRLNDTVFTIAGVTPPEFFGVSVGEAPEISLPLSMDAEVRGGESWRPKDSVGWLAVIGRVRPGRSIDAARAEAQTLFQSLVAAEVQSAPNERQRSQVQAQRLLVEPAGNGLDSLRLQFSEPLRVLMGITALVLLIACANLANLLLGRSTVRRREIAVRLAMGASRGRVMRQLLTEGLLLAGAGGAIGVLLAVWSANLLVTVMSNGPERIAIHIHPDPRLLGFAAVVSLAASLLFSAAPALQASRGIQAGLSESRSATRWRLGRGLIVAQVAISVVLVIGAGLFARTLARLYAMEGGFERAGLLLFSVDAKGAALRGPELQRRVLEELQSVPGVTAASFALSPIGNSGWDGAVQIEGYTHGPQEDDHVHLNAVTPGYFNTMGTPVLLGREFDARDTSNSPKVVVANQAFARRYFNGRQAIGRWVSPGKSADRLEIVGVAKDLQPRGQREGVPPTLYISMAQRPAPPFGTYLVRGAADPVLIAQALRRVDPKLRPADLRTMEEHLSRSILQPRIMGALTGCFGALSLLLVSIGVYGVMTFQVARRQKEIGIRLTLGARPVEVTGMVLTETLGPVAVGVAVGIVGALALTRVAREMLFGVTPTDPVTFVGSCAVLVALALVAAYLPSRSAAKLDPVKTLRCE